VPATEPLTQLLHDVLTSRVYDVARETPLDPAQRLSRRLGNTVLFKREDLQPVFSFKLRGAYNKIAHLTAEERSRGIIAASAGNHAQGVAFAARELKLRAVIVMPQTTPQIKVDAVKSMGADPPQECGPFRVQHRTRPFPPPRLLRGRKGAKKAVASALCCERPRMAACVSGSLLSAL